MMTAHNVLKRAKPILGQAYGSFDGRKDLFDALSNRRKS